MTYSILINDEILPYYLSDKDLIGIFIKFLKMRVTTVRSSELDTHLMRYGVKFTSYRIKSVYKSLDQTVGEIC